MPASEVEIPPRAREILEKTSDGREALREMTSKQERFSIKKLLGTLAKGVLIAGTVAGGLALGAHTGFTRHIPLIGGALDRAGRWIIGTAAPTVGTHARTAWEGIGKRWSDMGGRFAGPEATAKTDAGLGTAVEARVKGGAGPT